MRHLRRLGIDIASTSPSTLSLTLSLQTAKEKMTQSPLRFPHHLSFMNEGKWMGHISEVSKGGGGISGRSPLPIEEKGGGTDPPLPLIEEKGGGIDDQPPCFV